MTLLRKPLWRHLFCWGIVLFSLSKFAAADVFNLALLLPYSWNATGQDAAIIDAVTRMSLVEANALLTANGNHTFNLTAYDIGDVPAKALKPTIAANRTGAVAIIGAFYSSSTIPIALAAGQLKIWQCSGTATSIKLSDKTQYPYFFRMMPPDNFQGVAHAQFAQYMSWNVVSVLYSSDAYGSSVMTMFQTKARQLDIQILSNQLYTPGSTAAEAVQLQLRSIRSTSSRIVFFFGYDYDLIPIWRIAKSLNMVGNGWTWIGGDGTSTMISQMQNGNFGPSDYPNADGFLYVAPAAVGPRAEAFRLQLVAAFPDLANLQATTFYFPYDCVLGMAHGIVKLLQWYTPDQIKARSWNATLADFLIPFDGVTGQVQFDPVTHERSGDFAVTNVFQMTERPVYLISSYTGQVSMLSQPTFYGNSSAIPPARPQLQPGYPLWSSPAVITLSLFAGALMLAVLTINAFLWQRRAWPAVKSMSLPFLTMISVGVCLSMVSTVFQVGQQTGFTCAAYTWALVLGMQIVLSAVAAKTFRIWRIFSTSSQVKASTATSVSSLMAGCILIIAVQSGMLLGWMVVSPPYPTQVFTDTNTVFVCLSDNQALQDGVIYATLVYNCALVLTVIYLAYQTRNAYSAFRESNLILYTCQTIVLCGVLIVVFSSLLPPGSMLTLYYLRTVVILAGASLCFSCLVGRTALALTFHQRPKSSFAVSASAASTNSADDVRKVLKGEYSVKVINQLFPKWVPHHVILFSTTGHLGLLPVDSKTNEGTLYEFGSIEFDPQAHTEHLCLEFRVLTEAYSVKMPNEHEYRRWKDAFSTVAMVFGDQALYGGIGPALVLFAPNIRRHFGWDQVVAPPMTYPMPSRARSPPAGYDD
ncbi:hypothetical protein RI367_006193 [Sorochytrium milnesiophthora]